MSSTKGVYFSVAGSVQLPTTLSVASASEGPLVVHAEVRDTIAFSTGSLQASTSNMKKHIQIIKVMIKAPHSIAPQDLHLHSLD